MIEPLNRTLIFCFNRVCILCFKITKGPTILLSPNWSNPSPQARSFTNGHAQHDGPCHTHRRPWCPRLGSERATPLRTPSPGAAAFGFRRRCRGFPAEVLLVGPHAGRQLGQLGLPDPPTALPGGDAAQLSTGGTPEHRRGRVRVYRPVRVRASEVVRVGVGVISWRM